MSFLSPRFDSWVRGHFSPWFRKPVKKYAPGLGLWHVWVVTGSGDKGTGVMCGCRSLGQSLKFKNRTSIAGMNKAMQARWLVFALTVPISLYVSVFGTVMMGLCPGVECWPHTFAWTLLTPCLLLAILSLRATAITAVLLLIAHVYTEVHVYSGGLSADTLWGSDKALDKCLWIVVFLLVISALFPKKIAAHR